MIELHKRILSLLITPDIIFIYLHIVCTTNINQFCRVRQICILRWQIENTLLQIWFKIFTNIYLYVWIRDIINFTLQIEFQLTLLLQNINDIITVLNLLNHLFHILFVELVLPNKRHNKDIFEVKNVQVLRKSCNVFVSVSNLFVEGKF